MKPRLSVPEAKALAARGVRQLIADADGGPISLEEFERASGGRLPFFWRRAMRDAGYLRHMLTDYWVLERDEMTPPWEFPADSRIHARATGQ